MGASEHEYRNETYDRRGSSRGRQSEHDDGRRARPGFAVKFYTEEGNWDLVGNNTPVFFLRDPLKFPDLTKVWPHKDYPLIEVGVMELNRNPENFFAEVEQSAFNPANVVPGIGFSPDKMLQARLFSYGDAQRYRLGVNHHSIPVNAPRCPVHSYHRDGAMRVDSNFGATLGYEPNSLGQWQEQPDFREPPLSIEGAADHWNHRQDKDYYSQPRALFRRLMSAQRQVLFENTARSIGGAPQEIQMRHIANCLTCDPAYGKGIADALGRSLEDVPK